MKLMLLVPNFILMAIAGYNLFNEFTKTDEPNYLLFKILHCIVLGLSICFTIAIIRSMFTIRYVEVPQKQPEAEYNELELQHS